MPIAATAAAARAPRPMRSARAPCTDRWTSQRPPVRRWVKRIVLGTVAISTILGAAAAIEVVADVAAFDASLTRVYDVPQPAIIRTAEPARLAHGKQLARSVGECTSSTCHGADLAGGRTVELGPIGRITAPNITGSVLASYSDDELGRLLRYGIKRDGRSVLFMPVKDFGWLPDAELSEVVSYLRTIPAVQRRDGPRHVTLLGKVLDRHDRFELDVARRIDPAARDQAPPESSSPEYGAFLARSCTGCHGVRLSGGRIPGAPASLPVPLNLTPDGSGLRDWSFEDFERLLTKGVRKNGRPVDRMMPFDSYAAFDMTQKRALWAYLRSLAPLAFGQR